MMATKDGWPAAKSGLRGITGAILAALALGAILCGAPIMAQTAPPAQDAAPAAPPMEEPKSQPRVTDALLPSALPRDLSPWGMFLSAVPRVKIVMVGLAIASLAMTNGNAWPQNMGRPRSASYKKPPGSLLFCQNHR